MIIEDTREKKSFTLCESWSLPFERHKLDFGDYTNGIVYIERKSIPDVVNSVGLSKNWKRLQAEMERYETHKLTTGENTSMFIVIEGTQIDMADEIVRRKRRILPSTIIHKLEDLEKIYEVTVVWADDREIACLISQELLKE